MPEVSINDNAQLKKSEQNVISAVSTPKPIIQDIGDNAYNTLLDSPLAFLVGDKSQSFYRQHGLSKSSTNLLLTIGFMLSLLGFLIIKYSNYIEKKMHLISFPSESIEGKL